MKVPTIVLAFALSAAPMSVALADRAPTAEERAEIEAVLQDEGFTSWEEIEWDDDGYWEVDDAVASDGTEWDLKLDQAFVVIERERD